MLTHNVYDATPSGGATALKGTLTSTTATIAGAAIISGRHAPVTEAR